jgi:hypothetical protein
MQKIKDFFKSIVNDVLNFSVLDIFADLIEDIKDEWKRIDDAIATVITRINNTSIDKERIFRVGLAGNSLKLKFEIIKRTIALVNKNTITKNINKIRKWAHAAFKAINDFLDSLKSVLSGPDGIGETLDLIKEFKGMLENVLILRKVI